MSAENVAVAIIFGSLLSGAALFGTYLMLHRIMIRKYLSNDDFWFEAQPGMIVWEFGPSGKVYVDLNVKGNEVKVSLTGDYDFVRKLIKKHIIQKCSNDTHSGGDSYQVNVPVKVCVVGKDILGIEFGDFSYVPSVVVELPVELTPVDKQLKTKMWLNNIIVILAVIACIPGAWGILNYIASLLRK